jgi:hypothetical protein
MSFVRSARTGILNLSRKVKRVRGRWVPTNIQVLGHRGSGKTTFLKQLEERGHAVSGGETIGTIPRDLTEKASRIRFDTVDISGREEEWTEWAGKITSRLPAGLVFLIDHMRPIGEHEAALRFLIGVLNKDDDVKKRCKAFMLFANKRDLWQDQSDSDSFAAIWMVRFMPLLSRVEELGIKTLIGSGSAQRYELAPDEFDDLIGKFVDLVL